MAEIIIMPKLGFNMSTGKLVKWYKSEGQEIKKGEAFFSVETDKTNMDIEATNDGFVKKLLIEEGDKVDVTLPIAIVGSKDEDVSDLVNEAMSQLGMEAETESTITSQQIENKESVEPQKTTMESSDRIKISPRARRVAKERNIDINMINIAGTGYQGGICEADVIRFAEEESHKTKITPLARKMATVEGIDIEGITGSGVGSKIMKKDVEQVLNKNTSLTESEEEVSQYSADGKEILEVTPYSGVRRVIGDRMGESKFTAPHVYFTKSVDLTKLLELRKEVNASQETKTSVTDYIAKAVIKALQKYPDVNASLQDDQIIKYKTVNLGIAVAADSGLIVPNVKNAETMGLVNLSQEASKLIKKARDGKLMPEEYSGGTFTISNLGMFGIDNFTAIINQPESAILAVSATQKMPVVITNDKGEDEIVIRPMMNITLTVDHRLIDGMMAAQFVMEVKKYLESPLKLLV